MRFDHRSERSEAVGKRNWQKHRISLGSLDLMIKKPASARFTKIKISYSFTKLNLNEFKGTSCTPFLSFFASSSPISFLRGIWKTHRAWKAWELKSLKTWKQRESLIVHVAAKMLREISIQSKGRFAFQKFAIFDVQLFRWFMSPVAKSFRDTAITFFVLNALHSTFHF